MKRLLEKRSSFAPAYYTLRQLDDPNDLERVVGKCHQLARMSEGADKPTVVFLDGLDEMPNAMSPEEKRRNMLRLLSAADRADKLIITARSTYFRGLDDFWQLFSRAGDSSLWRNISKFIPASGKAPAVSAMALREFDTDQIHSYIVKMSTKNGAPPQVSRDFLDQLNSNDAGSGYIMLARNPLYLFLLTNSRPWASPDAKCLANVYEIFIKYWLERDVEKGRSRWNISTDDRFEFMYFVAYEMFKTRQHSLRSQEFDRLVAIFFGGRVKAPDLSPLSLDLQTTGIFSMIGMRIHFMTPAFSDYFVVVRFARGDFGERLSDRLPTIDQARMWAGLAETTQRGIHYSSQELLAQNRVEFKDEFAGPLALEPTKLLYGDRARTAGWTFLDAHRDAKDVRIVLNASLTSARLEDETTALLRFRNRKSLHARASAKVCRAYERWLAKWGKPENSDIGWMRRDGAGEEKVGLGSIMGLMMLAVSPLELVVVGFDGCTREELEDFLAALGCKKPEWSGKSYGNIWETSLGEDETVDRW
jgi:phosphotransferase system HPr-like phosphotransfer protein